MYNGIGDVFKIKRKPVLFADRLSKLLFNNFLKNINIR